MDKRIYEWAATCLSIFGAILNAFLIKEGFYIWGIANSIWVVVGIKSRMWGMALTFTVFLVINLIGIFYWK